MQTGTITLSANANKSIQPTWFPRVLLALLFCAAMLGRHAVAQTGQQFVGHIEDPSHASIAGATVTVTNEDTTVVTVAKATGAGDYTVPYLKTGTYTITVSMQGFKEISKTHIVLATDQSSKIDFTLPIGSVSETVTVNSEGSQIELSKADRGEIIDAERVQEMPSNGRNIIELFDLSPGTINTHGFGDSSVRPEDNVSQNLYSNGGAVIGAAVQENIDGATNDQPSNFLGYPPPPDSVAEFKVVLNPYDASYGRAGGGAIDITLKSGTNKIHGDIYEFARRPWLDVNSNSYNYNLSQFNKPGTIQCPPPSQPQTANCTAAPIIGQHKRDQFGVEVDGPVYIPHLYNGKDKTFFTLQWEQVYEDVPDNSTSVNTIPSAAWLSGDFSTATYIASPTPPKGGVPNTNNRLDVCHGASQCTLPLVIYDPNSPVTTVVDPNDGKTKRAHSAFPGNIVPMARLNPVALQIAKAYSMLQPNYNSGPSFVPGDHNFFFQPVEHDVVRNGLAKIDQNFGTRDRGSVRWEGFERFSNDLQNGVPTSNPGNYVLYNVQPKDNNYGLEEIHTFSANLILDTKATVLNERQNRIYSTRQPGIYSSLGFSPDYQTNAFYKNIFPYVTVSSGGGAPGAISLGPNTKDPPSNNQIAHTLAIQPSFTYIHGRHSIRAGLDMRLSQYANPGSGAQDQSFSFDNTFTQEFTPAVTDAKGFTTGSGIAALLLGDPKSASVLYSVDPFYSQHYYGIWAQDDWKATPKLTLNFGLRYDILTPRTERHNKLNYAFDTTDVSPFDATLTSHAGLSGPLMGGLQLAGVGGNPRGGYSTNLLNIQPRFGMAYAFSSRTSLRAGFGEEFVNDEGNDSSAGFSSSTGYTNTTGIDPLTDNNTPAGNLADPFGTSGYSKPPFPLAGNASPTLAQELTINPSVNSSGDLNTVNFKDPHYQVPSIWYYSVSLEQLLSRRDVLDISYSGTRAYNLTDSLQLNDVSPAWNAQCDIERGGNRQLCDATTLGPAQAVNPFYLDPALAGWGNIYSKPLISTGALTRRYPLYRGISQDNSPFAHSWYNAFQITASHNVSRSLTLHAAYTWSKAMIAGKVIDSVNHIYSRTLSTNDTPNVFTFSGVFYVPVGRGKTLLGNTNRLVDAALGGWEISPLYVYTEGKPINLVSNNNNNWEYVTSIGIKEHDLPEDAAHSYKREQLVSPCVAYKDTDTGVVTPGPAYVAAGCSSPALIQSPNGYAVKYNNVFSGARLNSIHQFDVSLSKHFAWNERANLQLRLDAFNVLNHPDFTGTPNNDPTKLDFGTIDKKGTPAIPGRELQISGKLSF